MKNIRSFLRGLRIVPSAGNNTTLAGELQVQSDNSNQLMYNNGSGGVPIVTTISTNQGVGGIQNKDLIDNSVAFVDNGDPTKKIKFDASGGVTATSTTINSTQTVNRIQTLQDVTDTFVYRNSTDTLTNKTMDGGSNTFTNLPSGSLSGIVTVPHGGTGLATLPANNVILGNGASTPLSVAPGTSGNVLTSNGTTWTSTGITALVNPMTTTGDIIVSNPGSTPTRLGIGTTGQALVVSGGLPSWGSVIPVATAFNFNDNQSSPANITGFTVNNAQCIGFKSEYAISRRYTGSSFPFSENTLFYQALGSASVTGNIVYSLAAQSNGQILMGTTNLIGGLVRLNALGTIDNSFKTNLGSGFSSNVLTVAVQANGQIVIGGSFVTFNGNTRNYLVRLNSDGTEDTTFYTNLGTAFSSDVNSVAIQSDGKIVVGGAFTSFNSSSHNRLVRLNTDGTEDTTFSTNVGTGFGGTINVVLVQANGQILAGGTFSTFNGGSHRELVRLNSNGTEDTTFYTNLGTGSFNLPVLALAQQANAQIVVGGSFTSLGGNTRNHLVRLNTDGTEDSTFATNIGTAANSNVTAITIQGTQILVGGLFTSFNGNSKNRLIRLNSTGTYDSTFATNIGSAFDNGINTILVTGTTPPEILVGGLFTNYNGNNRNGIVELNDAYTGPTELITQGVIRGIYRPSTTAWELGGQTSTGDDPQFTFSMTNAGQMQYTSSAITGSVVQNTIDFLTTQV